MGACCCCEDDGAGPGLAPPNQERPLEDDVVEGLVATASTFGRCGAGLVEVDDEPEPQPLPLDDEEIVDFEPEPQLLPPELLPPPRPLLPIPEDVCSK